MPWGKLSDDYESHPKSAIEDLVSGTAVALHAKAIAYCAKHLTDGHITSHWVASQLHALPRRQKSAVVAKALERGLFEDDGEGFRLHDYLAYNPSSADIEEQREQTRIRQERARERRHQSSLPWTGEATP